MSESLYASDMTYQYSPQPLPSENANRLVTPVRPTRINSWSGPDAGLRVCEVATLTRRSIGLQNSPFDSIIHVAREPWRPIETYTFRGRSVPATYS
jgi:hypothetical protein